MALALTFIHPITSTHLLFGGVGRLSLLPSLSQHVRPNDKVGLICFRQTRRKSRGGRVRVAVRAGRGAVVMTAGTRELQCELIEGVC